MTNQMDRTALAHTPPREARPRPPRPARFSALVVSGAVAVLYAALGLLTLRLGQLTGIASPVWPAAGVAFATALRWRRRALPGVFAGSAVVTIASVLWLTRVDHPEPRTWLVAAAVGIGAVLGAAAGAALAHRYVGPVQRLDTPRAVMLTLALGGLLATTIAPTIGVAAQVATGLLSPGQAALGWLTWWVGDSIGVIVFGPLALMAMPSQARYWSGRRWQVAVPSLLIFAILMVALAQNFAQERSRIDSAVGKLGDRAAADLSRNIALHQEVLEGLRGLVDSSDNITAREFGAYTDDMLARFPNLQALSWNPLVRRADLAAFEARQRAQPGLENFTVTQRDAAGKLQPVSARPEYVVVAYIQPIAKNLNALGFDIYSTPARAVAIETARDTGQPATTVPIDLVQESGTQKGMLALLPSYLGGADPVSVTARRAALRGFAVGVYRLGDLLAETFRGSEWDNVAVTLTDVTDPAAHIVISDLPARHPPAHATATLAATTQPLDVYGRSWELTVRPNATAVTDNRSGIIAVLLLAALAVTLLLEAFMLVLSGMESLARRLLTELGGAARYVRAILPRDVAAPIPVTARYIPSEELGGDSFDHRWIDDDHLIAYLIDISGHGVGPAMFSVSVHNTLRSGTLDVETLRDPGRVLGELNRLFPMDQQAGNYFTIWYGVYQRSTRTLSYCSAGHPPALVLSRRKPAGAPGPLRAELTGTALPVGLFHDAEYLSERYLVPPDSEILLYSDGAFELNETAGRTWTRADFVGLCVREFESGGSVDSLIEELRRRSPSGLFDDDCTIVRIVIQ